MAKIAPYFRIQENDGNGNPLSGGKLYTYEAGTSTPKTTYTSSNEGVENTNPIILDGNGCADVWLTTGSYKFVLTDSNDVEVRTVDNILGDTSSTFNASVFTTAVNLNITPVYQNYLIKGTSTLTLSLLASSSAGEGFTFTVQNTGTGVVTIDPDLSETIDGAATLSLSSGQWAIVTCDGANWEALINTIPLNNLNASTAPTINDDSSDGYSVNSVWLDVVANPKEAYRCLDASIGAAVWINTTLTTDELGSAATKDLIDDDTFATATSTNIPSAESVKALVDNKDSFGSKLFHIQDQKASGTDGGTFTSGDWRTRVLNTPLTNEISGASVSSNQFTLPTGTYYFESSAPARAVASHKIRIQNITDATTALHGTTQICQNSSNSAERSFASGRVTIAGTKTFEIQHRCSTTVATNGFGLGAGFGDVEVYTDVKIWKIS